MMYREYVKKKNRALSFLSRDNLSSCSIALGDGSDREEFSTRACECCGDPLAGARWRVLAIENDGDEVLDYWVCRDCLFVLNYGDLDDMTAMEAEKTREDAFTELRERLTALSEARFHRPDTLKSALRDGEEQVWYLEEVDAYLVEEINERPIKLGGTRLYGRRIAAVDAPDTEVVGFPLLVAELKEPSEERCHACDRVFLTRAPLTFCPDCGTLVSSCDACAAHELCSKCVKSSMFREFTPFDRKLRSPSEEQCAHCGETFETATLLTKCPDCGETVTACNACANCGKRCRNCENGSHFKEG